MWSLLSIVFTTVLPLLAVFGWPVQGWCTEVLCCSTSEWGALWSLLDGEISIPFPACIGKVYNVPLQAHQNFLHCTTNNTTLLILTNRSKTLLLLLLFLCLLLHLPHKGAVGCKDLACPKTIVGLRLSPVAVSPVAMIIHHAVCA